MEFPFPHVIALLLGGMIIYFLKRKFERMRTSEAVIVFILYAVLVLLFTSPVVNFIKQNVSGF